MTEVHAVGDPTEQLGSLHPSQMYPSSIRLYSLPSSS